LPKQKAQQLYETLIEHQGLEQVMIGLSKYGFGPQLSMKIYQVYKEETMEVIQNNPYQLIEHVDGIGFRRADELGAAFGLSGNHPERIQAACLYILDQLAMQEGHVFDELEKLILDVKDLLQYGNQSGISEVDITREIACLVEEGRLIQENERVYLPSLHFSEKGVVTNTQRMLNQSEFADAFPESELLLALGDLEERLNVQYASSQRDAIFKALSSPMMILTGGPGTGKTTVIKGIVEMYAELHGCSLMPEDYNDENPFPVLLTAPTGRAAKRMSEATGLPAVTIHRLLGWNGAEGFQHDEDQPIAGKLLIVDEFSMVDIWLANQLFKSLPNGMQVILVGDEDQLPSVGPGQVLKDLLQSNVIPTVQLTDIFRQSQGSSIIDLAHQIKQGQFPDDVKQPKVDRRFFPCKQDQILEVVTQVCKNALKKGYTAKDIQVLAPMYKGPSGIEKLNAKMQEIFNPKHEKKREIAFGDVVYRVGDKVLQLVNQPDQNVFNGDMGEVISIIYAKENVDKEDQVILSFEGNEVVYTKQELTQITHAYCCSIHKSQGSEFPIVLLPMVKGYYRMLRRNLIYTAVTRSKEFLILCGEEDAFKKGINRADDSLRKTTLKEKLTQIQVEEDRNVDVENLSPYDFLDES
jgi:exodeoxyribonuclease V alpha subunit